MNQKKAKGIGIISGGLDSMVAVKVLQEQDLDLLGINFSTPFFPPRPGVDLGKILGIPVRVVDLTEKHLEMLKNPHYGYGSQMNPCIDCHGLMLREAGRIMEAEGGDFIFTGEVLGQRPMSQRRDSMRSVEKLSGYPGLVLRPLSAKFLPPTIVETEGLVDRNRLLDIQGRSRKRQEALARQYGIRDYPQPGDGCMLTKEGFANRLKDLLKYNPDATGREVEFLKRGRHYRLPGGTICIIGRNRGDNEILESLANGKDVLLKTLGYPGPLAILLGSPEAEEDTKLAARILIAYSDAPTDGPVRVAWRHGPDEGIFMETRLGRDHFKEYLV
jgi:hypothetical protein